MSGLYAISRARREVMCGDRGVWVYRLHQGVPMVASKQALIRGGDGQTRESILCNLHGLPLAAQEAVTAECWRYSDLPHASKINRRQIRVWAVQHQNGVVRAW